MYRASEWHPLTGDISIVEERKDFAVFGHGDHPTVPVLGPGCDDFHAALIPVRRGFAVVSIFPSLHISR